MVDHAPPRRPESPGSHPDEVVVAIDVGGTGIKCGLVDADRRLRHTERHPTLRERGPEAVRDTILDICAGLTTTARERGWRPLATGVVVPGSIDEATGSVPFSANLGFRGVPLRGLVADRTGLPTALGHDARAGGLAEARLGAGRGVANVLVLPIGTGIAGAHVVDGRVNPGAHGAAGEIGHVVVRPGGPRCGCGQRGCMETYASATAVARRYTEATGVTRTAAEVSARLGHDPDADRVWAEAVDALADGLLIGQALFDPELVVIGGGLAQAGDALLEPLRAALAAKVTFHRLPRLTRARLGDDAGCLGAGLLALDLAGAGRAHDHPPARPEHTERVPLDRGVPA